MSTVLHAVRSTLGEALEEAHRRGVAAASAGLQDAALGECRLTGPGVANLADAAVTSATPFLRAPLLARISEVLLLHRPPEEPRAACPVCRTEAPCDTYLALQW